MGGSVKVVSRLSDGTVSIQNRWTNNLHSWLDSIEFTDNTDKFLLEYIKAGEDSDYNDDEDPTLAPEGYGLIVIDNMTKKIFSYQDYTSFSFYHPTSLSLDFNLRSTLDLKLKDSKIPFINLENFKKEVELKSSVFKMLGDDITFEDEYKQIKQMYDFFMHGHIKLSEDFLKILNIDWSMQDIQKKKIVFDFQKTCHSFSSRTINDWKLFLQLAKDNKCYFLEYDYHPFKVQDYQNFKKEDSKLTESEKIKTFLKDLQDAGFKFRKKDLDGWKEFSEDYD